MSMKKFLLLSILLMSACQTAGGGKGTLSLQEKSFESLPGWTQDNLQSLAPAFEKSCKRIMKASDDKPFGALEAAGTIGDWQTACRDFLSLKDPDTQTLQSYFEFHFAPHAVLSNGKAEGLFTGYFEASLKGSRKQSERYNTPLYKRNDDLVMVQLGEFREDLKGRRIAGRVIDGKLKPYESREEIVAGDYPHKDEVLVWVDDPIDAFFVQIQGSGVVELEEGGIMRIGYAGQNGHVYYAIGRELIKRGHLTKENVSLQSIKEWLYQNPDQADAVMNTNASYVFFEEKDAEKAVSGPIGGEGIALTAGRSLAIDRSLLAYGMPVWTDIAPPIESTGRVQKLMVTQDTGGAIRGPVRGDVFWGYGDRAEELAGPMKSKGRYWILLPQSINN